MKLHPRLRLYSFLATFRVLRRSYTAKIMLVAFLGTHIPLLLLLLSFLLSNNYDLATAIRVILSAPASGAAAAGV